MISFAPYPGATAATLHAEWTPCLLRDVENAELRAQLLKDQRFAERLIRSMCSTPTPETGPADARLSRLANRLNPAFLSQIGQLWFAPVIAPMLLTAAGQLQLQISDKDVIRSVLRYRTHTTPEVVGALPEAPDFAEEGVKAVESWLENHAEKSISERLRLVFRPGAPLVSNERIALIDRVLDDTEMGGV